MKRKKRLLIIECIALGALILGLCFIINGKKDSEKLKVESAVENEERVENMEERGVPMIVVSEAKAKHGDKVTITADIVNNPGVLGMAATLSYDEKALKLVEVKEGEAVEDVLTMSNSKELNDGCVFLWDGEEILPEQIKDGTILNLEFKVLKSAPAGKTPVMLILDENGVYDNELQTVNLNIENGLVTIIE